jgi:uncharacterized protein DUF2516
MALAAPNFVDPILFVVNLVFYIAALVIEVVAFGNCLFQRSDAFPAIGTLPKGAWLALTGGSVLITLLFTQSPIGMIGIILITIAAVYLLDVRPALRDAVDGHGPW